MVIKKLQQGVTIIEMLVVVAIIALVSSILIFNYSDFSTNVSVRNLSQEVALAVRKAQTYATSVHTLDNSTLQSDTFPGYGISFSMNGPATPADDFTPGPRQFVLFADTFTSTTDDSAGMYNYDTDVQCGSPSTANECLESFSIITADKIDRICARPGTGRIDPALHNDDGSGGDCYDHNATIDISFRRPSPDALLCLSTPATDGKQCNISNAIVYLKSAKGLQRSVVIWNTGQISVR